MLKSFYTSKLNLKLKQQKKNHSEINNFKSPEAEFKEFEPRLKYGWYLL